MHQKFTIFNFLGAKIQLLRTKWKMENFHDFFTPSKIHYFRKNLLFWTYFSCIFRYYYNCHNYAAYIAFSHTINSRLGLQKYGFIIMQKFLLYQLLVLLTAMQIDAKKCLQAPLIPLGSLLQFILVIACDFSSSL